MRAPARDASPSNGYYDNFTDGRGIVLERTLNINYNSSRTLSSIGTQRRTKAATPTISLRERPEQALFHISFSIETEAVSAALGILERAALRLDELATSTQSTLVVERFDLPHEPGKQDTAPCSLHLTLTVPLAQKASTWERAAQLAQVDDMLRALVQEGRKHKPRLDVHRALPVFVGRYFSRSFALIGPSSSAHSALIRWSFC